VSLETCVANSKNTGFIQTRLSELQLPVYTGASLSSSKVISRKNVSLKPIDRPKTPAVEPISSYVRGYRLNSTTYSSSSPPSTPLPRNLQLPPLETHTSISSSNDSATTSEKMFASSRSSARDKYRVTFNSRIVSATDNFDACKPTWPPRDDSRPNTTSNAVRHDVPHSKRLTDLSERDSVNMKVIGHAAHSAHSRTVFDSSTSVEKTFSKEIIVSSIPEDVELLQDEVEKIA